MNAIELIEALKGADGETGLELIERLQCGQIDCSVLPSGKDNAVQQAQIWAQEARTQKGIVEEIGKLVGCANDWETVSAVKAALSGAQQGVAESAINEALESGGWWASCSGCHETNEGVSDGPRSIFGCHSGSGCHECGGIGVIWHESPTDEQLAILAADPDTAPQPAQVPDDDLPHAAQFLLDRLADWGTEYIQEEGLRDWVGHVEYAIARLESALTAAPSGDAKPFTETSRPIDDAMVGLPNGSFKAFHASLCRRFGYPHDDQYWWRDLVSLEEHIAAGFGDAKREAEELRKDAERYQWLRNRIFAADLDYGGLDAPCLIIALPKGSIFTSDANETIDAARLRQSDSGDDSEEVV